MANTHLDAELSVEVLRQVLCGIHATVLPSSASEGKHQVGEPTLDVACHMGIGQLVNAVEEGEDFPVILKESYDRFVETSEELVWLVSPGVVRAAAVKDIPSPIAGCVIGDAFVIREAEHPNHQGSLAIIF